jgi:HIV Tat-specific factor 1
MAFAVLFLPCRFGGWQIHASEDDGSINHSLIRDYDAEVSRLDRFGEELEEST